MIPAHGEPPGEGNVGSTSTGMLHACFMVKVCVGGAVEGGSVIIRKLSLVDMSPSGVWMTQLGLVHFVDQIDYVICRFGFLRMLTNVMFTNDLKRALT